MSIILYDFVSLWKISYSFFPLSTAGDRGLPAGLVVDGGEEFGVFSAVVFVEVEPKAEETQALIGMGAQHEQELLYHILQMRRTEINGIHRVLCSARTFLI